MKKTGNLIEVKILLVFSNIKIKLHYNTNKRHHIFSHKYYSFFLLFTEGGGAGVGQYGFNENN